MIWSPFLDAAAVAEGAAAAAAGIAHPGWRGDDRSPRAGRLEVLERVAAPRPDPVGTEDRRRDDV